MISVMVDCNPFPVEPCARAGGGEGEQEGPVAIYLAVDGIIPLHTSLHTHTH